MRRSLIGTLGAAVLLGCGGSAPNAPNPVDAACASTAATILAPGQLGIVNLTTSGCVSLPATTAPAEYIAVAYSAAALTVTSGIRAQGALASGDVSATAQRAMPVAAQAVRNDEPALAFHDALRTREATLAERHQLRAPAALRVAVTPPAVGSQRTFQVCSSIQCDGFTPVAATARFVGRSIAIYVDNTTPAALSDQEIASTGALFDDQLYPLDVAAFGEPSDLDNNGVVVALLTPAVNRLSGNCTTTRTLVLGYFYGVDLVPPEPGSNAGEVFFSLVPDPTNPTCTVSAQTASTQLPVTFVHEFQHMINFRQKVLTRGSTAEATWLNEGLSHFAEELAGRAIPDAPGTTAGSRLSQFAFSNVDNAYSFLLQPELSYLVYPTISAGTLEERGAVWLFVRWLADHYGGTGGATSLTRKLLETGAVGAANVEAATGRSFDALVGEWLLATALDDRTDLPAATPATLGFSSWNFRSQFQTLNSRDPGRFPYAYPLRPDEIGAQAYNRAITLKAGTGRHVRITQAAGGGALRLRLATLDGAPLNAIAEPRLAIVRIK